MIDMPRAILFDAVGTLIFADPPVAEVYRRVGCDVGCKLPLEEVEQRFRAAYGRSESLFAMPGGDELQRAATSDARERMRWLQVVGDVFSELPPSLVEKALSRLWDHFAAPAHWRLFDDVSEVWESLESRGLRLGIASNFDSRLRTILKGLPPLNRCGHIFISSEVGHPKPSPLFFQAVEEQLELTPDQLLLVGDDYVNDIVGGRRRGWQTIWLSRATDRPEGTIGSLRELPDKFHG